MNSIKTLLVAAVLAAGAYGVYYSVTHRQPDNSATSEAPSWPTNGANSPTMQIPGPGGQADAFGPAGPTVALPPGGAGAGPYAGPTPSSNPSGQTPPLVSPGTSMPQPGTLPPASSPGLADPSSVPFPSVGRAGVGADVGAGPGAVAGVLPGDAPPAVTGPASDGGASGGGTPGGAEPGSGEPQIDPEVMARFDAFMDAVQSRLDQGRLAEAHLALSTLHDNPDLPAPLARRVTELLDQLAGTVIFSRGHYLEPAYHVRPGDTLELIARDYQVPALLLARINGIADQQQLRAGQELKVVRGPFSAVIHLERFELTLMLNGRYAGRFPIGIGGDAPELIGAYTVREKISNPAYYGPDGANIDPDDPRNPLGEFLLDLGEGVALHGTDDPASVGRINERGIICLTPRDIDDLFGILSIGSQVVIER